MKTYLVAAILIAVTGPTLAQTSGDQHHPGGASVAQAQATPPAQTQTPTAQPGARMPMGQMMQGQGMPGAPGWAAPAGA
ncbi:hypothetical protein [Microvirga arsenatis]|uniref:Uncharacterized protein n=1 Tax=Microvirga arsenatis TaxID=2692265 RepID=A0ABW9YVJ3_9HYPH|nr:hypothetical protein [Microvirga arsenatis]NBJ10720.1 hypothetical protein [Microvirga arsenatis]NBJ24382.1 hypothetical protein [Microvirga arsenatis]